MSKIICIGHMPCQDGFTAMWCVRQALGAENVEFVPAKHGDQPPDVTGRDVVIVDFSYKRDVLIKMADRARTMLVLDHHLSAQRDLEADNNFICDLRKYSGVVDWPRVQEFRDQDQMEGVPYARIYALFDMERSGASLTWDFFHPGVPRPWFVDHVEDRDLWRFKLPHTREVAATLFSHEYDFAMWDVFARADQVMRNAIIDQGEAIERKHHKDIAELVARNKRRVVIADQIVWGLNVPYTLVSDAGHALCELDPLIPFACCYFDSGYYREFSLRSLPDGADVSEIAKKYGGGGHAHAAGFRLPIAQLSELGDPK